MPFKPPLLLGFKRILACGWKIASNLFIDKHYVYSVTAPERATLGVKLAANGEMTMDQLKLRYNGQPSAETRAMAAGWLAEAFRRRSRRPAGDG